ncbi:hypothetical protein M408DRAFT_23551 [Serendipita vermifera MAFF 305830]|uniref:Uncharacterized protein n=1 Tax=Serendipita vermifera MAFF 305830 TaxID=933852 RepID=A0A0C3B8N4_SERVB|nr:hypothetical protein M408DRAFT_23551 [Serendipita vermifera MAFF 305830]
MQLTIVTAAIIIAQATQSLAAPIPASYEIENLVTRAEGDGQQQSSWDRLRGVVNTDAFKQYRDRTTAERLAAAANVEANRVPSALLNIPLKSNVGSFAQTVIKGAQSPQMLPPGTFPRIGGTWTPSPNPTTPSPAAGRVPIVPALGPFQRPFGYKELLQKQQGGATNQASSSDDATRGRTLQRSAPSGSARSSSSKESTSRNRSASPGAASGSRDVSRGRTTERKASSGPASGGQSTASRNSSASGSRSPSPSRASTSRPQSQSQSRSKSSNSRNASASRSPSPGPARTASNSQSASRGRSNQQASSSRPASRGGSTNSQKASGGASPKNASPARSNGSNSRNVSTPPTKSAASNKAPAAIPRKRQRRDVIQDLEARHLKIDELD